MNDYRCPKHPTVKLSNVMRGGAGHCSSCGLFVQAAGVEMPARERPRLSEKEAAKARAKLKRQAKAKATT